MYPCDMLKIQFDKVYACIFASWFCGYADDDQLVEFLIQIKPWLYDGYNYGLVITKENNMIPGVDMKRLDTDQQSICRTRDEIVNIFRRAGYRLILQSQTEIKYHPECVGSHMYCFQPYDTQDLIEHSMFEYKTYRHKWSVYTEKIVTRTHKQDEHKVTDLTVD